MVPEGLEWVGRPVIYCKNSWSWWRQQRHNLILYPYTEGKGAMLPPLRLLIGTMVCWNEMGFQYLRKPENNNSDENVTSDVSFDKVPKCEYQSNNSSYKLKQNQSQNAQGSSHHLVLLDSPGRGNPPTPATRSSNLLALAESPRYISQMLSCCISADLILQYRSLNYN